MRTLGQKRAEFALNKVADIPQDKKEKFKPFSAGAPSMILQNGFGQALAFWIAKGKNEHMTMFNIVKEWLCRNNLTTGQNATEFIKNISQMEQTQYLTAQKETLALLEWVKRYANAGL
ncbi:MAG: type III-B CRISPR module-associated protein Cmr5 [Desulfobacterium sp.]|nr:type III-B CRISPR module-associated protein Cmr5 [Desulfobacterium sp.]